MRAIRQAPLRLPQRIIIGFIETLDCAAVKALIPNLQVRAEGFGCAQVLNGITEGFSRCREPPIFREATLRGLEQEQFSRSVIVEGRHASTVQPPACRS